jgi:hypothetical protein
MHRDVVLAELNHRLTRLERKMGKTQAPKFKPQSPNPNGDL